MTVLAWLLLPVLCFGTAWWLFERSRRRTHPVPEGHRPEISIRHGQPFELYHNALSLCSMKTRVCLAELGIPYASHHVELIETGAYENIRPDFLSVNPAGTVPVLIHEGHPVYESHAQIRYAARHAPPGAPSLLADDPLLETSMEAWVDRASLTRDPLAHGEESVANAVPGLTIPLFAAMIDRIAAWKIFEGLLFHFDRLRPVLFLTLKTVGLPRIDRLAGLMRLVARSRRQIGVHLDALEAQLVESGGPWILGATFTLADVSWLVVFERLVQADCLHVFVAEDRRPACAAYWERLKRRPSYRKAILERPHPTIAHGTRRLRDAKAARPRLRLALEGS